MKALPLIILIGLIATSTTSYGQQASYKNLAGVWENSNPSGSQTVSYTFTLMKEFTSVLKKDETEIKAKGTFRLSKKGKETRLVTTLDQEAKTVTIVNYYFIRFLGQDTLKIQNVTSKQRDWQDENEKNTLVFVRKKEKSKG